MEKNNDTTSPITAGDNCLACDLTRMECTALRGLAILGIVLHNFCHWLNPVVKENEYQYIQHNVDWFQQVLLSHDQLLPAHLLSFFGHYGVPIFLFLSAYGLERKYGKAAVPAAPGAAAGAPAADRGKDSEGRQGPGVWAFVRYHFLKLFKMMIVGFICFIIIDRLTPGPWHYTMTQVLCQLGMVNNLLPDPDHQIWPGPFWFFGLMLQLYIVYRLLMYRRSVWWTVALMVVCVGVQLFLTPDGDAMNRYRYNFMGGMLPFGLGLCWARYMHDRCSRAFWLIQFCAFTLAVYLLSLNFYGWTFVPALVCVAAIALVKAVPTSWLRPLIWLGDISAALFVIHPVLRKIFIPISRQGDIYTGLLLYFIAAIGAAWLIRELMKKIPNPKMK
jgi:peptidoglycan/LPS O-acetylase OafA/YrhL